MPGLDPGIHDDVPSKPEFDEMGRRRERPSHSAGPSTMGKPGMHAGFKASNKKRERRIANFFFSDKDLLRSRAIMFFLKIEPCSAAIGA